MFDTYRIEGRATTSVLHHYVHKTLVNAMNSQMGPGNEISKIIGLVRDYDETSSKLLKSYSKSVHLYVEVVGYECCSSKV